MAVKRDFICSAGLGTGRGHLSDRGRMPEVSQEPEASPKSQGQIKASYSHAICNLTSDLWFTPR